MTDKSELKETMDIDELPAEKKTIEKLETEPITDKSKEGSGTISFKVPSLTIKPRTTAFTDKPQTVSVIDKPPAIVQSGETDSSKIPDKPKPKVHSKLAKLSPAEILKHSNVPIPYKEPSWGARCVDTYSFEIIKNGTVIDTIDLSTKSHYVFGRLPSCDISMEHPSLSRHHAVVQFCGISNEQRQKGWYLYDLDSTHGTWLNKNKINGRVYHRLKVGFMVKFGGSSRLHILQGPSDDQEEESDLSITEMKLQREKQIKEVELLKQAKLLEMEERERTLEKQKEETGGCSWGMGDDAFEVDGSNPFASEKPENESLYLDDPKKSLRGYFEREGLDLPDYEVEELDRGKYQCRVELPVDNEITGEPIVVEATVTGKKKEAVAACALEACRVLDKMGELRKATHESRKRKSKNWEENDFYDSDDDTFLDRTGDIERKRKQRMKRLGKADGAEVQTYESIISQLQKINEEMKEIQIKLDKAKADAEALEAEEGLDALDMFMANIKSGAMDTKTRMSLKRRMFELKQEQTKLERLKKISQPANIHLQNSEPLEKARKLENISKPGIKKTTTTKMIAPESQQTAADNFEVEEDEEDDDNNLNPSHQGDDKLNENTETQDRNLPNSSTTNKCTNESDTLKSLQNQADSSVMSLDSVDSTVKSHDQSTKDRNISNDSDTSGENKIEIRIKGPALPPPGSDFEDISREKETKKKSKRQPRIRTKKSSDIEMKLNYDPDYASWLPPKDQSGDGKTSLNAKFGY